MMHECDATMSGAPPACASPTGVRVVDRRLLAERQRALADPMVGSPTMPTVEVVESEGASLEGIAAVVHDVKTAPSLSEIIDLRRADLARVEKLEQLVAAQAKEIQQMKSEAEEDPLFDGVFDNIYSLAVHESMWPTSAAVIFRCLLYSTCVLAAQIVLVQAFLDTAWLGLVLGQFPLFADSISFANFYYTTDVFGIGGDQPAINLYASTTAFLLLGLYMRKDNISTLATAHPIEILFEQDWPRSLRHQPLLLLWRSVAGLILWAAWCVRAMLLPAYAGVGGALALAGSARADEIVLNSVAISFLFELDDMFYTLTRVRTRAAFEKSPLLPSPLPTLPKAVRYFELPTDKWAEEHATPTHPDDSVLRVSSWVIYAVDFISMFGSYAIPCGFHFGGLPFTLGASYLSWDLGLWPLPWLEHSQVQWNPANDVFFFGSVRALLKWHIYARCVIFSVTQAILAVKRHKEQLTSKRGAAVLLLRILLVAGSSVAGAAWLWQFYETLNDHWLSGWTTRDHLVDENPLTDCLMQANRNASCINNPDLSSTVWPPTFAWATSESYGPWGTAINTAGWSTDPSSESFYGIPGIGDFDLASLFRASFPYNATDYCARFRGVDEGLGYYYSEAFCLSD